MYECIYFGINVCSQLHIKDLKSSCQIYCTYTTVPLNLNLSLVSTYLCVLTSFYQTVIGSLCARLGCSRVPFHKQSLCKYQNLCCESTCKSILCSFQVSFQWIRILWYKHVHSQKAGLQNNTQHNIQVLRIEHKRLLLNVKQH